MELIICSKMTKEQAPSTPQTTMSPALRCFVRANKRFALAKKAMNAQQKVVEACYKEVVQAKKLQAVEMEKLEELKVDVVVCQESAKLFHERLGGNTNVGPTVPTNLPGPTAISPNFTLPPDVNPTPPHVLPHVTAPAAAVTLGALPLFAIPKAKNHFLNKKEKMSPSIMPYLNKKENMSPPIMIQPKKQQTALELDFPSWDDNEAVELAKAAEAAQAITTPFSYSTPVKAADNEGVEVAETAEAAQVITTPVSYNTPVKAAGMKTEGEIPFDYYDDNQNDGNNAC